MLAFCCFNPVSLFYFNSFRRDEALFFFFFKETACHPSIHGRSQTPKENTAGLQNLIQPMKHFFNSTAQLGSQPNSARMVKLHPRSVQSATRPHRIFKFQCDLVTQQISCESHRRSPLQEQSLHWKLCFVKQEHHRSCGSRCT